MTDLLADYQVIPKTCGQLERIKDVKLLYNILTFLNTNDIRNFSHSSMWDFVFVNIYLDFDEKVKKIPYNDVLRLELPQTPFISKILRIRSLNDIKAFTISVVTSENQTIAQVLLDVKENDIVLQPEKHNELFQALSSENARYLVIIPTWNITNHLGDQNKQEVKHIKLTHYYLYERFK